MGDFNTLPEEITLDILSRVSTETVLKCKLVCTNWRSFIRPLSFSKMHFKHQLNHTPDSGKLGFIALRYYDWENHIFHYFEYNKNHESTTPIDRIRRINFRLPLEGGNPRFLGSCNGLICLAGYRHEGEKTYICNPITRECIMLPEIKRLGVKMYHRASGFGYVSSANEYKIVRIMSETEFEIVYVYTLGSGCGWRNLGEFNLGTTTQWGEEGTFVNEALYWIDNRLQMIVPFDLAEEKFCDRLSFPMPPDDSFYDYGYKLGVLDGCFSFATNQRANGTQCWYVWQLKRKNDNHFTKEREEHQSMGWNEEFGVYANELIAITMSHGVLTCNGNRINIQDSKALVSKTIVDFDEFRSRVFPHKNTLVSLKELGEKYTKMIEET